MNTNEKKEFGLIGYPLTHSFSKQYYDHKIVKESIQNVQYSLFSIADTEEFSSLFDLNTQLFGVNVTIPHKISILSFLDRITTEAQEIGAVNCIKILRNDPEKPFLIGFNTDIHGFKESLRPLLKKHHKKALVLGNGGAAKAVHMALKALGIDFKIVSRNPGVDILTYGDLTQALLNEYKLIINTTPLGTFPEISTCPDIPYNYLSSEHLAYDLVYNPEETLFLQKCKEQGCAIKNGYEMLILQAEKNWEIWMDSNYEI